MTDAMTYSEFFSVDKGYYPETNPNSVKDPNNDWKKTFPHPTFIKMLKYLERMLSWEVTGKKHCLWVQGAFGTGKSQVVWATEQLMTCPEDEFLMYFNRYDALKKQPDLRDKLLAHKRGKILTVFRYASGDITDNKKLITAIYESVSTALKKAGYDAVSSGTIRGKIIERLQGDELFRSYFESLLHKPEYRNLGSFNGKNVDSIIAQLSGSGSSDNLLSDIVTLSEKEGITAFRLTMDNLKAWLSEVIDTNGLNAILFIWDEFSSYFRQNKNALDEFQSLMELCAEKPFEMIIVTHMAGSLVSEDDQQFKTIRDRFEECKIEMPDTVAFDLIGNALVEKEAARDIWSVPGGYRDDLASAMPDSLKAVREAIHVEDSVLQHMIPIHPMAALMLKHLAENFASNNRSMFNFIKNGQEEDVDAETTMRAFQWFIRTHSPEERDLLTIDYLWDFFYEKGTDEHTSGTGRSNLDMIIAGILDTYPSCENRLNKEQRRVLKTVLLMQAISRKRNNAIPLLIPTEKNIRLAFEGTEGWVSNPIAILKNQLVKELKILFASPIGNSVDEYVTAAIEGDQQKIDEIVDRLKRETTTAKLLQDGDLVGAFSWGPAIKMRFQFTAVTADNFTSQLNKLVDQPADWHMLALICFARNEAEQRKLRDLIADSQNDPAKREIVIIDATGNLMGIDRFAEWAKFAGNEEYWRSKDDILAGKKKNDADDQLAQWKQDIADGSFLVYYRDMDRRSCSMTQLCDDVLPGTVLKRFPFSFDNAHLSENWFKADKQSSGAKAGATETPGGIFQDGQIRGLLSNVWKSPNYWERPENAHAPITEVKKKLDQMIQGRFASGEIRVSQIEILSFLINQYGFTTCNLYAFLVGFLLKEYRSEPYHYGIGDTGEGGDRMTVEKLCEHIGEAFKHIDPGVRNYKEKFIEIMTPDQKAFLDFAVKAFDVPESCSVTLAASKMRTYLKKLGYPIWCFTEIDTHDLGKFIERISDIANDRTGDNVPNLAGKLGKMLRDTRSSSDELVKLLTKENGREALAEFLKSYREGKLIQLAGEIDAPNMIGDVSELLSAGEALWLWNQQDGEAQIDKLIVDYQIVAESNRFAGNNTFQRATTLPACIAAWRDCARFTHIPKDAIRDRYPELKSWLNILSEIHTDGFLLIPERKEEFLKALIDHAASITEMLSRRQEIFADAFNSCLNGLEADEVQKIYAQLPRTSFSDNRADFVRRVNQLAESAHAEQKKHKLQTLWKQVSGYSGTPREWSDEHQTPILALIPDREMDTAQKTFTTLESTNPSERDIESAMEYLKLNPSFLSDMKNPDRIDAAFVRTIIGKYRNIISLKAARDELATLTTEAYDWLASPRATTTIRNLATNVYASNNQRLVEKIDTLDVAKAKELLLQLVKENVDVGIAILNDEV